MSKYFMPFLRGYKKSYLKNDIIAGVMVAALTVPVAMGYAEVAGLPPVYGLYTSILPVLGYALFASSPQLIFGMDAAASAITGSVLLMLGISAGSSDAITFVPVLTLFTGIFLVAFAIFKLGKIASFISMPVMSGFISGLGISIIVSQVPKIMGLTPAGSGFIADIGTIFDDIGQTQLISLAMGLLTLTAVLLSKKFLPKIPMGLLLLIAATAITAALRLDQKGVTITGEIPQGLPPLAFPDFSGGNIQAAIGGGLVVSIVVFASSILPANSFAVKNNYTVNDNQELTGYGIANILASLVGSSPACASLSRTATSEQFKGKTQLVSLVSAGIIALVVAFMSGLLYYMPQAVLSGIIAASLVGVVDIKMFRIFFRRSRMEWVVWLASAAGVLLVGILFGVLVGVLLSFLDVAVRAAAPPQAFLGVREGKDGFYDMKRYDDAKPVRDDIVIYRFTASLFFANIELFKKAVYGIAEKKPKAIIVDAEGITNIDYTAAEGLKEIVGKMEEQKINFYFAGEVYKVNEQMKGFGLKNFVESGHTQKTLKDAVRTAEA